jgi:hypothetical protein
VLEARGSRTNLWGSIHSIVFVLFMHTCVLSDAGGLVGGVYECSRIGMSATANWVHWGKRLEGPKTTERPTAAALFCWMVWMVSAAT